MTMPAPTVELRGVSKWFGLVLALNEVSASFGPGVSGLLGPNGAGKSTLLNAVCGILKPSLGSVRVCGEVPFDRPRVMRRVGFCPEHDAVYRQASILDVVTYLTRLHGFSRRDARARAQRVLERVGLGGVVGRSAATFSKGMRQRAKLALALAHEPDVVVLDEPLNGLDPGGRRQVGALIRALGDEGRCVLVSSHILHEVQDLSSRVLLLNTGRVLAEGTVSGIRADLPEHPLTVRIATDTPTALAARLATDDAIRRLERHDGGLEVVTRQPEALFDALAALTEEPDVRITAIESVDEDLEAVFRYLTR